MFTKECPHLSGRVDAVAIRAEHPFRRDSLAARPLVAFSLYGIERHVCVVSAVRILQTRHIRRNDRFVRVRSTLVSPGPILHETGNARKAARQQALNNRRCTDRQDPRFHERQSPALVDGLGTSSTPGRGRLKPARPPRLDPTSCTTGRMPCLRHSTFRWRRSASYRCCRTLPACRSTAR